MDIEIEYSGKWPALCMGYLVVVIDGVRYDFGLNHVLESGGSTWFTDDYANAHISEGPWSIADENWPDGFTDEMKDAVITEINSTIPWGCCGGCL